ncbi:NAD(P)/FAD-dependent oxidoreductase [Pseudomonadota bacterium]
MAEIYDHLIIGAGCAGASGAMYSARLSMKTAMVAILPGGLITTTHIVENWPGIKEISGPDLAQSLLDHAMSYDVPLLNETVTEIRKATENPPEGKQSGYIVKTKSNEYMAKTLLLATGTEHKKMGVPGEAELTNKGVSYCALCDSGFVKGKVVGIVGGGDSAAKEALLLSELCEKVYIFVRGEELIAEAPNMKRLKEASNVEIMLKTEITEILGTEKVEKVKLKSGDEISLEGLFIAIGHYALSDLAKLVGVELTERGEVKVDRNSATNMPGIFAAGDVTDSKFKQAITSAASAVNGAYGAFEYLQSNDVVFD